MIDEQAKSDAECFQVRPANSFAVRGWLVLAVSLFLLQTLPYLSYRWVTDESWYAATGYSIEHGNGFKNPAFGPNEYWSHFDARPPGTAIVIATAFRLLGEGQIPARLGSILAGLAIILLISRLARDVIGEEGALIAVFLTATDNLIVITSRSARPEALTTMAIVVSLLAMKRYAGEGRIVWVFLSGFLIAMGTMFHITVLGYVVSLAILAFAIDRRHEGFGVRGVIGYGAGYAAGLLPFAIWLLTAPMGRIGFRMDYLNRATSVPLWTKFLREGARYSDMLGLHMISGHGLDSVPVRFPIPLFLLLCSFLLWKYCRRWFYLELLLLVPTAIWFIYTLNKSSRYLALLSPVFALIVGGAVAATRDNRRLHRILVALSCVVIVAQMSANFLLLHAARSADYNKVGTELRSVIPEGQTAYGTMTFWLALRDRTFISYERTDPWMAANQFHARYFVTGDRVMTNGLPGDEVFYRDLNRHLAEVISQSKMVGHFPDPYYGDLKVYKLAAP